MALFSPLWDRKVLVVDLLERARRHERFREEGVDQFLFGEDRLVRDHERAEQAILLSAL